MRAALTTQPDYDSFAVTMSGQPAGTVTVPILPAVLSNQSSIPAAGQPALATPTGIAINGTYAYVTNQAASATTVSVINIATGAVVKTITVGSQPSAVAISPTAKRAYVTNRASGTVTVINTDTNTVVGSAIRVGTSPQDVAVNSAGHTGFRGQQRQQQCVGHRAAAEQQSHHDQPGLGQLCADRDRSECRRHPRLRHPSHHHWWRRGVHHQYVDQESHRHGGCRILAAGRGCGRVPKFMSPTTTAAVCP